MKLLFIFGYTAAVVVTELRGAVLRERGRVHGFGADLVKNVAGSVVTNALGLPNQQQQQMQQQMMQSQQALEQSIPDIDVGQAAAIASKQNVLNKQAADESQRVEKMLQKLQDLKTTGSLDKPQGITAFQGVTEAAPGGATPGLMDMEAPIITLVYPALLPQQQIEADKASECLLKRMGDSNSPAMAAAQKYEMKKLGEIKGGSEEAVELEIKKTESNLNKRQDEREKIYANLKKEGRALAKHGSPKNKEKVMFANTDLKTKDKEIQILIDKLAKLKGSRASFPKGKGPSKEAGEAEDDQDEGTEI